MCLKQRDLHLPTSIPPVTDMLFFKMFFFLTLYMFVYRNFNPNVAEKLCRFILRKKSANYSTLQKIR